MSAEVKKEIQLEIAHVLFIDIVGYSKRSINEQRAAIDELNELVRTSEQFQKAEASDRLIKIPTGDGMALVFYTSPEAPAQCAIEISRALKEHSRLQLRMGVHSGPVSGVIDVTGRANLAGAGLNMAQRVMDCGDAGHILLSKHVAEDLEQYAHWQPYLHDLGECAVKHGTRVHAVNLYTDEVGNPEAPQKFHLPMSNFFSELKRRNVYKVAVAYIVAGWALSQGIAQVFPVFDVPNWVIRSTVLLIIIGLPIALVLAWMFELTPAGLKRTQDVNLAAQAKSYAWLYVVVVGGVVSIGLFFLGRYTAPSQRAAASGAEKSIAVLPFENLSRDPDNAYFATGIQDEILTRIAKIGALKVISRVSTKQYSSRPDNLSEIAHQLGVANILEGSVQRAAHQVHINVQLIRAATDEHLWAESYDRKLENIFGVEAEVATAVAEALDAKLTGAEQRALEQKPTNNPEAYDAYLRGIALWSDPSNIEDMSTAIHALEKAVRLDPDFATAWAMLAQIHSETYLWVDATPSRRAAAQKALETALRLQPDLPEVQIAAAVHQYKILGDFDGARRSFEQLHTKLPNNVDILETLGVITLQQGRWDESRAYFDKAIWLNPRNRDLRASAASVREATRDFLGALQCYDQALNIWPDDRMLTALKADVFQCLGELDQADGLLKKLQPSPKDVLVLAIFCGQAKLRRRYSDAIPLLRNWLDANRPDQGGSLPAFWVDPVWEALGNFQRLSGDVVNAKASYIQARDKLEQRLKEAPDDKGFILDRLARSYAGLGDAQLAMKYIERAISRTPASKDVWTGPGYEETRGRIAARFGMKDIAIPTLEHLLKTSYRGPLTPALLRLDPDFDSLRDDPRFEKLAHSDGK